MQWRNEQILCSQYSRIAMDMHATEFVFNFVIIVYFIIYYIAIFARVVEVI